MWKNLTLRTINNINIGFTMYKHIKYNSKYNNNKLKYNN